MILEALAERVLIYDGAMGTQLQAANLSQDDFRMPDSDIAAVKAAYQRIGNVVLDGCNEILNLTRPDIVQGIHERYLLSGADLIETNTFGATDVVLGEYDIAGLDYEISLAAGKLARAAADKISTPDKPRFVVGAVGPGTKLISLGQISWKEVEETYFRCFLGLIEAKADALLLETMQDLLLVKAGIVAANRAFAETQTQLPLFVSVTMEQTGTMLVGSEMSAALNMIEAFPSVITFGLNCATGPVEMAQHIRYLSQNSTRPISVLPNAGLPVMEKGQAVYKLGPEEFANHQANFVKEYGAALVGGCCGTTPEHIAALSEKMKGATHTANAQWIKARNVFQGFDFNRCDEAAADVTPLIGCSSLYSFQPYKQDSSFLIVGERTNANGSKAFRDMLAAENWEGLTELAREQEMEGSHVLDVCTAYVGRDEARDMAILLSEYNRALQIPCMIDSTEVPVIETALQHLAGKPIVNSINFEDGGDRAHQVLKLCRKYGAAVVALTIDETGMAKTVEHKVQVADRLLALTREYGLPDHDVFIDCLTFTLGSGDEEFRDAGKATIEAIRELLKRHPRVNTLLGVSNISFGLKPAARIVLNSAFLHFCLEAGLSSAIVHFSKIKPDSQIDPEIWKIAEDLVFDRRQFAVQ
jgi:5-methyltetrahydrofolate--homocysteine methyltransferase